MVAKQFINWTAKHLQLFIEIADLPHVAQAMSSLLEGIVAHRL